MLKNIDKKIKRSGGFALLFSVLVSSLLLTIGLSIFNIALKELAIATAAERSIHAFYAADSGREYVLYHDIKLGDILIFDTNILNAYSTSTTITGTVVSGDSTGPNYSVKIEKSRPGEATQTTKIETTIIAKGYDSADDGKLERAIQESY